MLTPEEQAIADDFERGWSDERLAAARKEWGPGIRHIIPAYLAQKIADRATEEGTTDLQIITYALAAYLDDQAA